MRKKLLFITDISHVFWFECTSYETQVKEFDILKMEQNRPLEFIGYKSRVVRKRDFCPCENKGADSCAVTAQLFSAFVFATRIVQCLFFLNPRFQASSCSLFLWLYMSVCVRSGRKPRSPFSCLGAHILSIIHTDQCTNKAHSMF